MEHDRNNRVIWPMGIPVQVTVTLKDLIQMMLLEHNRNNRVIWIRGFPIQVKVILMMNMILKAKMTLIMGILTVMPGLLQMSVMMIMILICAYLI